MHDATSHAVGAVVKLDSYQWPRSVRSGLLEYRTNEKGKIDIAVPTLSIKGGLVALGAYVRVSFTESGAGVGAGATMRHAVNVGVQLVLKASLGARAVGSTESDILLPHSPITFSYAVAGAGQQAARLRMHLGKLQRDIDRVTLERDAMAADAAVYLAKLKAIEDEEAAEAAANAAEEAAAKRRADEAAAADAAARAKESYLEAAQHRVIDGVSAVGDFAMVVARNFTNEAQELVLQADDARRAVLSFGGQVIMGSVGAVRIVGGLPSLVREQMPNIFALQQVIAEGSLVAKDMNLAWVALMGASAAGGGGGGGGGGGAGSMPFALATRVDFKAAAFFLLRASRRAPKMLALLDRVARLGALISLLLSLKGITGFSTLDDDLQEQCARLTGAVNKLGAVAAGLGARIGLESTASGFVPPDEMLPEPQPQIATSALALVSAASQVPGMLVAGAVAAEGAAEGVTAALASLAVALPTSLGGVRAVVEVVAICRFAVHRLVLAVKTLDRPTPKGLQRAANHLAQVVKEEPALTASLRAVGQLGPLISSLARVAGIGPLDPAAYELSFTSLLDELDTLTSLSSKHGLGLGLCAAVAAATASSTSKAAVLGTNAGAEQPIANL